MALLGVVGTIAARMVMTQQRFYHITSETMSLRRELRTAMTTLPADLRGISSVSGDISSFDATQITFRATLGAAVICAKPDVFTIDVPPLNTARTTLTSWYTAPVAGDTVFAFRADSMGAGGDRWSVHRITGVSSSAALCPASPFTDAALDAGKLRWSFTVTPALPDSVKVGAAVRFSRSARFSMTAAASGRNYLSRAEYVNGVWTSAIPIAGPFLAPIATGTGGIRLAMYDSTGAVVATGGNAQSISRIDIILRGQGVASSGTVAGKSIAKDSIALRIALRNRQ